MALHIPRAHMSPLKYLFALLLFGTSLFSGKSYGASRRLTTPCANLPPAVVARVELYLDKRLHRAHGDLILKSTPKQFAGSCFTEFAVTDSVGRETFTVYLGPDRRYLTSELYDLAMDPATEERLETRRLAARLVKGVKTDGNGILDASGAPTLVIFSDFQCPYCKKFVESVDYAKSHLDGGIQVVYRALPLPMHPWARLAADVAACVQIQSSNSFWKLYQAIYDKQSAITAVNARSYIEGIIKSDSEVNVNSYEKCMAIQQGDALVTSDLTLATDLGVTGTPTFFIDGVRHDGVVSGDDLVKLLETAKKANDEVAVKTVPKVR